MGLALDTMTALTTGERYQTALNVPNEGAIDGMEPGDVVEVSCAVDGQGVHPQRIGAIPEPQALLMRTVKLYERLAVEAIARRSRAVAAEALMVHPLVYSFPLGKTLVDEYLEAHRAYVGEWT
jgi:6-phospho-beta-glucosidase